MIVKPVPVIAFALPARPLSVRTARRWLRAFAGEHGGDRELQDRIATALSEAVANAVLHAYTELPPGAVHITADIEDGTLEIVVADDGGGMAASPSDERAAGLGLNLVARSTDGFSIRERATGGTELWMRFKLATEDDER
jgi:anti-sigma regulatory factor (Ser/Thr protein kinase)